MDITLKSGKNIAINSYAEEQNNLVIRMPKMGMEDTLALLYDADDLSLITIEDKKYRGYVIDWEKTAESENELVVSLIAPTGVYENVEELLKELESVKERQKASEQALMEVFEMLA